MEGCRYLYYFMGEQEQEQQYSEIKDQWDTELDCAMEEPELTRY